MPRRSRTMTIGIEGMDQLMVQLKKLQSIPTGQDVKKALLDGAEMIRSQAQNNAPIAPRPTHRKGVDIQPGGLRASFKAAMGKQYKTFLQAFTFTLARLAPHAHLVEFGTKPHTITGKKMKIHPHAFQWLARLGDQIRTKVHHPGSRPNPFFRNAIRSKRSTVRRHIEVAMKQAFEALSRAA